ncbi:hypothetical protein L6452_18643 [Arctium lappa]|uniref:Uncharacterized protein n=1 Tax=Arctium lappa TaxID=4217 RepID=A0ACB9C6U8_ARCLA|nr:hypothetical protein L6452_18643 [Arctium lappa]
MASMTFIDEHNEITMLQKPKQAAGFHQIVDFLKSSHIVHALTVSPTIYIEHQRQFWANANIVTENGVQFLKTRVCDKPLSVSEEVIRICLRLDDAEGITSLPNEELFSNLSRMGWSEFSSTIAYALVCLATARKYNFSRMIFSDLVSNLGSKKSFYMYPRFVQEVITHELTDMPNFDEVYVPKIPKGKVFSNMKRSPLDSEGVDTPLFSTMMVVSHTEEGMAAGSRPSLDHPTASQSQPSHSISIPQSLTQKPTSPITQTYIRKKVKKAPSLVPSHTEPLSPLRENSPLENIYRETTGVSPNPKEVLTEEMVEHMGAKAATTPASTEEKTSTTKRSNDHSKGGNTPGEGEDRYDYNELMETMGNINLDVIQQRKEIDEMKLVILSQQVQITKLKKLVMKLVQKKKKRQFVLRRRKSGDDAPKKGESEAEFNIKETTDKGELDGVKHDVEGERFDVEGEQEAETEKESQATAVTKEQAAETINAVGSSKAAEMVNTAELREATEIVQEVLTDLEIAETLIKAKHDTLKVTSKAKGVVIKDNVEAVKKVSIQKVMSKEKGKAKLVESDQPMKKQKLIESDEALARKIQAELEEAENVQVEKDREIAKAMAAELNKAYK